MKPTWFGKVKAVPYKINSLVTPNAQKSHFYELSTLYFEDPTYGSKLIGSLWVWLWIEPLRGLKLNIYSLLLVSRKMNTGSGSGTVY